ncbi:choice-of-anchor X domain-containing protein [Polyangium aurulentum]|uniref:choice-of-anchor X domain-containing protein n=1 Tax=Polyangium aurulentum TaxID=2567896 RepID=UPI0010AE71BE|nr:choice-of-anchor X domain-containing protein [Polyangium aurulentum]UQA56870.1 hypothetical protein E8A73_037070 [Polyangium aurulentum]
MLLFATAPGCGEPMDARDDNGASALEVAETEVVSEAPLAATRVLAQDPPEVERLLVEPLPSGGNALLLAHMASGQNLPERFDLDLEEGRVTLRDDGQQGDERARDGVFSAIIDRPEGLLEESRSFVSNVVRVGPTGLDALATGRETFEGRSEVRASLGAFGANASILELSSDLREGRIPVVRPSITRVSVDEPRSLMITDLSVVENPARTFNPCNGTGTPMGKWTFGHLMTQMANEPVTGVKPSEFVLQWLQQWSATQTVNGFPVPQRNAVDGVIARWPKRPDGSLDLAKAPFRLLAIVNRVDLRENLVYGAGSAGEGRFVFSLLGEGCQENPPFTVIFEYGVRRTSCPGVKSWGNEWVKLSSLPLGSPAYLSALERITDQFARANAAPNKPNGSALNQVRTNEVAFGKPWELREFRIAASGPRAHMLLQAPVAQTPDEETINGGSVLARFIDANAERIRESKHVVPREFPAGRRFQGGAAATPDNLFWSAPGVNDYELRKNFSLGTCNGCHAGETRTAFLHVVPTPFGKPAGLSAFLTGGPGGEGFVVADPGGTGERTTFSDLDRRRQDLADLVGSSCLIEILRQPIRAPH